MEKNLNLLQLKNALSLASRQLDRVMLFKNSLYLIIIMVLCTAVAMGFRSVGIVESEVMVYLLGIFLFSYLAGGYYYSFFAAVLGVLSYNFFFTEPYYTFNVYRSSYLLTFSIMFIVGFFTSMLTIKIKRETHLAEEREKRINSLYQIERKLLGINKIANLAKVSAEEISDNLFADVLIQFFDSSGEVTYRYVAANDIFRDEKELIVCREAYQTGSPCGRGTNLFSDAKAYYMPIITQNGSAGIIGVSLHKSEVISGDQIQFLEMIAPQIIVVLERESLYEKQQKTEVQVQRERLRADMLRTISHDLRTPLTGIMGSASTVIDNFENVNDDLKKEFLRSIYNDANSLNAMVENILSMTRFDDGNIKLNIAEEAAEEIAAEAIESVKKRATGHIITAKMPLEIILFKVDGVLIKQVLVNLIENAVKYTPQGSEITVTLRRDVKDVVFEVADNGPGIADEDKPHVFERFFSRLDKAYGSRRGTGLGLSICKAIVEIHGGTILVEDNNPQGTLVRFFIPLKEENICSL